MVHHSNPRDWSAQFVPNVTLTDLTIRSLKSDKRQDFWDTKLPGFGVRVGARSKTFIVKIGNVRRSIGTYPDIALADARKRAMALKSEKPKEGSPTTFLQAYEAFKAFHVASKKKNTQSSYLRILDGYYLPEFRDRTLDSITTRQLTAVTDELSDRPGEQWHAVAVGRTFFKFCIRRQYIPLSPMDWMQITKNKPRDRVLSDSELKAIWSATGDNKMFSNIVRLLLMTGQRRGEISGLQKSWIGENEITLPKEITKNGREHRFPIGPKAISILRSYANLDPENKEIFVFPARGRTNISFNGWNKSKAGLDEKLGPDFAPWTLHDLRRTFATNMAKLGVRLEVTEKLLNHVSGSLGGIVAVYQRYDFQAEMRQAVERWETKLSEVVSS